MPEILIGNRLVGADQRTYFIADIAANHDGELQRAKDLIFLAAEAGADAAKFQNFQAAKIVSDYGFSHMNSQVSHQATWKKSVFEVYAEASVPFDWTPELKQACDDAGIHYFSSPYDFDAVDMLDAYVPAYKIGSGDITWIEIIEYIARKGKPLLLATGASSIGDVQRAVDAILKINSDLILMQCNTNYTASPENFHHIHLNVLRTYAAMFPDVALGLSDHTSGHATVLGAVALGARVIEKHFTDDITRTGPDHAFAMDPVTWRDMVDRTCELEQALGNGNKNIAENEIQTVSIQRRCVRAAVAIKAGQKITRDVLDPLRPADPGAIQPYEIPAMIGATAGVDIPAGASISWKMLAE